MKIFTRKGVCLLAGMLAFSALNTKAQQVFYESFNGLTSTEGGNDGYFDNEDAPDSAICEADLTDATLLDNKTGWGDFVALAQAKQCIRISSKKNSGSLTTPAISLDGADGVLTFCAAGYSTDNTTLYIKAEDSATMLTYNGETANQIAIVLPASVKGTTVLDNQTYSVGISKAAAPLRLTFSTVSTKDNKQRAFIDEIKVAKTTANGIGELKSLPRTDGKLYSLDGREMPANSTAHGIYIMNGKKIVR